VPVVSFYSKEKRYLSPVERKQLRENLSFGERSGDESPPAVSRTEKVNVSVRSTSSKPTRPAANPKRGKAVPKTLKKVKADVPPGKPSVGKENAPCLIKKKMDSPFRVLSMTVKPALKLQAGAAFFAARRKSHSKKPPAEPKPPQAPPGALREKKLATATTSPSAAADRACHADHTWSRNCCLSTGEISFCLKNCLHLQDDDAVSSSPSCGSDDYVPSSQSPRKGSKEGPSNAVVYPIFSATPTSKKRMQAALDELSPPGKTPPSVQRSKRTKERCKGSGDQMIIDAGQKHFGTVVCKSCGMIYTAASPEDEAQHLQHHERFLEGLRYMGWKKERVVAEFWDGKIVLILPDDPKYAVKKAEDVREIVDNELGFKQVALSCPAKTKTYLFVSSEKMIVGCLVAESINQAFRVLAEPAAVQHPGQDLLQQHRAWRCSAEPQPAVCGVSRIWVLGPARRRGVARRLVDAVRSTFMYGSFLSTEEIAFSDPTPDGKLFATRYCQTPTFLVYNFVYSN
ncbi:ESCO2 acetyltransferase, partial [Alectura lathami]|nr:ESCO2 acetyltransferase [Alectura lathami]